MDEYRNPKAVDTATHSVGNQPPPLTPYNLYTGDIPLQEHLSRQEITAEDPQLVGYGERLGDELFEAALAAEASPPQLRQFDSQGFRIDEVIFHPAWHQLMDAGLEAGIAALPWRDDAAGRYTRRAALNYLHHQIDAGSCCPMTMTFAAVPCLQQEKSLAGEWLPKITGGHYDPANRPWFEKSGVTIGMAMTEKQGGTDVRANLTRARPVADRGSGKEYFLTGHKWFCSAPMSDAFLVLAQAGDGLSCFLMPRWRPDGRRNSVLIQRLKDKLGNHSNASSEIELDNAFAWLIGDEGRGIATIMQMVALTRFDCVIGSAALMRQALVRAFHHCRYRGVGGKALIEQPLMKNVLADLALESEASLALGMHLATRLEQAAGGDTHALHFVRITTAISKYWVCRRTPAFVNEAAECLGGAGYVEDSRLPWLYREAPLNATWEGCSNVQCLDVLRSLRQSPEAAEALFSEFHEASGQSPLLDDFATRIHRDLDAAEPDIFSARHLTGRLALALQAAVLFRGGNEELAHSFCQHRLQGLNHCFGNLTDSAAVEWLLDRAGTV